MKQEKIERVATLKERIERSEGLLLTEYRGLTVHDTTVLRRSLAGMATFGVVKNTLLRRAAHEAGLDGELDDLLNGPTAVAFVEGDIVGAAKKIAEAAKEFPSLVIKGAYFEGRVLRDRDAKALATLDTREVMLAKIAGLVKSEMVRAASLFQTLQGRFLSVLEAYKEKVPAGGAAAAAAPAAEAVAEEPVVADAAAAVEESAPVETGSAETTNDEPEADAVGTEEEE